MLYSIILACTFEGGIGYNNYIPWDIKSELCLFKQITVNKDNSKQNAIIMGRKTWDSLPRKPLKDRINIVITSDNKFINYENVISFSNIDSAFEYCERSINIDNIFVIGGKSIYDLCLNNEKYSKNIENIYLSIIYKYYNCNIFIDIKKILTLYKCDFNTIVFHPQFLHMRMTKKLI
jgi:dihydrofolate reductase